MSLPPIPSDRPGSASRFKGVNKSGKKWVAYIWIPSKGGSVHLGSFDSEEEAGIMHARAHYKYPAAHKSAPNIHKRPGVPHRSLDFSTTPVAATDTMSDTSCMVCGLTSDPFIVLLCDGCDNEAHLACVGLSHVPEGEWFCSSCCGRGLGHRQPKAAKATKAPRPRRPRPPRPGRRGPQVAKSAATFRGPRREPDEIDEVDGIVISAFSGPSSAQAPRVGGESSSSRSRPKMRPRTHQHQHRARVPAQPPKPPGAVSFRHQLLSS